MGSEIGVGDRSLVMLAIQKVNHTFFLFSCTNY